MRRQLLTIAILLGIVFWASLAEAQCENTAMGGGITCVMSISASSDGSSAPTLGPFTSSGNLEVIAVQDYISPTQTTGCTVSDNKNPNPVDLGEQGNAGTATLRMWYISNPVVGSGHVIQCGFLSRITVTFYQTPVRFAADERRGLSGARGTASLSLSSLTPTLAPALVVGSCAAFSDASPTMSNLTPLSSSFAGNNALAGIYAHTTQTTPNAIGSTCTSNGDRGLGMGAMLVAFNAGCTGASPNWSASRPAEGTVEDCLRQMQAGDTLTIAAGTAIWTSALSWTAPPNVTIQGQTVCTSSGRPGEPELNCQDNTIIVDGLQRDVAAGAQGGFGNTWFIFLPNDAPFRITGITFKQEFGTSINTYDAWISFRGISHQFRFDHNHIIALGSPGGNVRLQQWILGVLDHNQFDIPIPAGSTNAVQVYHSNWNDSIYGDGSWADDPKFSSGEFVFMEDNRFTGGFANDLIEGGRLVVRYNTFFRSEIQSHNGSIRQRASRELQVYGNKATCDANAGALNCGGTLITFRGGTGLVWGNQVDNIASMTQTRNDRSQPNRGIPLAPNGWGYCGTSLPEGPSPWDQNADAGTGYACLDQVGFGKGDLIQQTFFPINGSWPNQQKEPLYQWNDTITGAPGYTVTLIGGGGDGVALDNRDSFMCSVGGLGQAQNCATFNGTSGVGVGLWANRPSTCTPWTAYWAIDQGGDWNKVNTTNNDGELFVCDMNNTFQPYYTPYTYPHPLATPVQPMMVFSQQPTNTVSGQPFNPAVSVSSPAPAQAFGH